MYAFGKTLEVLYEISASSPHFGHYTYWWGTVVPNLIAQCTNLDPKSRPKAIEAREALEKYGPASDLTIFIFLNLYIGLIRPALVLAIFIRGLFLLWRNGLAAHKTAFPRRFWLHIVIIIILESICIYETGDLLVLQSQNSWCWMWLSLSLEYFYVRKFLLRIHSRFH